MKLVISIVHRDDAEGLLSALMEKGYRATKISTTGGFLREGNATILVGVEEDRVPDVLDIIKCNCHTRTQYVTPLPPVNAPGEVYIPMPIEVQVGGATVFILEVWRFLRF